MALLVGLSDRSLNATPDESSSIPAVTIEGAYHPDWSELSFSDIAPVLEGGGFDLRSLGDLGDYTGEEVVEFLGYDPSRSWEAGTGIADILKLGDFESTLGNWSLGTVANYAGIDLQGLKLSDFRLLESMSLDGLLEAVPNLGVFKLKEVKPLYDAAKLALGVRQAAKWANLPVGDLGEAFDYAKFEFLDTGGLSLAGVDLSQYGLDSIPGLEEAAFSGFSDWKGSFISDIPGLDFVPIAKFIFGLGTGSFLGKIDVVYGDKEANRTNTITGSFQEGFNVPCNQPNCAHLELTDAIKIGNISVLKGKQWISGNSQQVNGGSGFLTWVNSGKEPTGRHPFGDLFKVVLLETNESQGKAQFGIYFRFCLNAWFVKGCSPYFIGPFPWFYNREKDNIFVGLDGVTSAIPSGLPDVPQNPGIPPELLNDPRIAGALQQEQDYGTDPDATSTPGTDECATYQGINFGALQESIEQIESRGVGGYHAVGPWRSCGSGCRIPGGRALGKYQYMTYRDEVIDVFRRKPGGLEILQRSWANAISETELREAIKKYFPPDVQERVFRQDMQKLLNAGYRMGYRGSDLVYRVAGWHHAGTGGFTAWYADDVKGYYEKTKNKYTQKCQQKQESGKCTGQFIWPAQGIITSGFGMRNGRLHAGIDIANQIGTPIIAADSGTVRKVVPNKGACGIYVEIEHCDKRWTRYCHLSEATVKVDTKVNQGKLIGKMGSTGRSTGPHLHFELYPNGRNRGAVDPIKHLPKR